MGWESLNPSTHASVPSRDQTRNTHTKRRHGSRKELWGKKGHSRTGRGLRENGDND